MVIKSLSDTNKVSLDIKDLCLQFYFVHLLNLLDDTKCC